MTTQTTVNYAVVFADGPGPLNIAVIVVRSVNIHVREHRFSISVRHAITDVGLSFLATELNTIVTFCQTASIMYCCAYTFQLFFARTAREVYEPNREYYVVHV